MPISQCGEQAFCATQYVEQELHWVLYILHHIYCNCTNCSEAVALDGKMFYSQCHIYSVARPCPHFNHVCCIQYTKQIAWYSSQCTNSLHEYCFLYPSIDSRSLYDTNSTWWWKNIAILSGLLTCFRSWLHCSENLQYIRNIPRKMHIIQTVAHCCRWNTWLHKPILILLQQKPKNVENTISLFNNFTKSNIYIIYICIYILYIYIL